MRKSILYPLAVAVLLSPTASNAEGESASTVSPEDEIFLRSLQGVFPLDPGQIGQIRQKQDALEEATTRTPVARISSESRALLLEPGKVSAPITLTPGYVGSVVFFDITGAPWPVARAVIGNEKLFSLIGNTDANRFSAETGEVLPTDATDSHVLYITPLREHANSNILVHLQGASRPVIVQLVSSPSSRSSREHDGIVSFMVSARGPHAKPPIFETTNPSISAAMMSILDGVPPQGSEHVKLSPEPAGVKAWRHEGKLYLRSAHSLVWPAYVAYAEGSGMFVYELPDMPSIIVSQDGRPISISIGGER